MSLLLLIFKKDDTQLIYRRIAVLAMVSLPFLNACSGGSGAIPSSNDRPNPIVIVTPNPISSSVGVAAIVDPSASPLSEILTTLSTTLLTPINPPTGTILFQDNFPSGDYSQFTTAYGKWSACPGQPAICSQNNNNETNAGNTSFADYTVTANIIIKSINTSKNTRSGADLTFRVKDTTHFYELEIAQERDGSHQWQIWVNNGGSWLNLRRGLYNWSLNTAYNLRITAIGNNFVAAISKDGGNTYQTLGNATDATYSMGQIGLRTWNGAQASFDTIKVLAENGATMPPATPVPTATPIPSPTTPSATPTPLVTPGPTAPPAGPTMTPIPAGASADNAYTIAAPTQPDGFSTPAPLCIAGSEYKYLQGDDFTQETQYNFNKYVTQWEINQYQYNGAKTNWVWSDQYSGIGRRNDFGAGDTYMVHIDDANPSRSYPASWVNTISPRPGNNIMGTPPNAYLDIRAVAVPTQYVNDASLNQAHWLTGGLQSGGFTFGYSEATVQMTPEDGAWPALWDLQVPGGGGWDGTGTSVPGNYYEIDTFEKFGNTLGINGIQMTDNSGRDNSAVGKPMFVRPQTPGATTSFHKYGQLWVPPILGNPSYIVFYIDRQPVSYFFAPTGIGNVNMNVNLQMGIPGSFVGTPDKTKISDLLLKNYYTWQNDGLSCGGAAQANPIPTPTASPTPQPAPPVASNIAPKLQPYANPVEVTHNTQVLTLANTPAAGDLIIAQGVSGTAFCPTGFTLTGAGDAYLCTGIVGQNGLVASKSYNIGGAGFDIGAIVDITNVTSYTINPDTSTGWHSEANPSITKTQSVPGANELALAFGFNILDSPRYATSVTYNSNVPYNVIYKSDGNYTYNRGMTMMEVNVDPFTASGNAISFTGNYAWTGTPSTSGNNLFPFLVTILVK